MREHAELKREMSGGDRPRQKTQVHTVIMVRLYIQQHTVQLSMTSKDVLDEDVVFSASSIFIIYSTRCTWNILGLFY